MLRRRQMILASLLLGVGVVAGSAPHGVRAEEQGDCGYRGVTVVHDDSDELDMACAAVADVSAYFRGIGFEITPRVSLRFADRSIDRSAKQGSTHGYFDRAYSEIVVYRVSAVRPWGLRWTAELARSFLRHELAHVAIWEIVGGDPTRLRREWHEFIAYAVQLDLTDPQLRGELLATQSHVRPFENLMEINEFTSRMDPDLFAVAAYKTYLARGARKFVAQLLRAEIVPPPFSYPFPVLPSEVPTQ